MTNPTMFARVTVVFSLLVALIATSASAQPGRIQPGFRGPMPKKAPPKPWNEAELVFSATLQRVVQGPVGMSLPPMYTHTLHFTVVRVFRGSLKPGDEIACSHVARQQNRPTFPKGKLCVVAAAKSRGSLRAAIIEEATEEKLGEVAMACALPLGWKVVEGKPVSPWKALGENAWPSTSSGATSGEESIVCSKTGRPALMAGSGVSLQVESVPPKESIKWTNPDGDGEYKITVTNTTDQPIEVPALLSQGDKILWEQSLAILSQKKAYACPGCSGFSSGTRPTKLAPGQSVSTTVNVLRLKGPTWPRGGYRIEFQFCLGEKSQTKSLYYMSRHHDKLRAAVAE